MESKAFIIILIVLVALGVYFYLENNKKAKVQSVTTVTESKAGGLGLLQGLGGIFSGIAALKSAKDED